MSVSAVPVAGHLTEWLWEDAEHANELVAPVSVPAAAPSGLVPAVLVAVLATAGVVLTAAVLLMH